MSPRVRVSVSVSSNPRVNYKTGVDFTNNIYFLQFHNAELVPTQPFDRTVVRKLSDHLSD